MFGELIITKILIISRPKNTFTVCHLFIDESIVSTQHFNLCMMHGHYKILKRV